MQMKLILVYQFFNMFQQYYLKPNRILYLYDIYIMYRNSSHLLNRANYILQLMVVIYGIIKCVYFESK